MTDDQLVEAAAKAAGLWDYSNNCIDVPWSPLTDDGDALRLAVKLNISVYRPVDGDSKDHWGTWATPPSQESLGKVRDGSDAFAATRRAIVCAAASMSPDLAAGGREGVR